MKKTKYTVKPTAQFKKDFKRALKRGRDMTLLENVIADASEAAVRAMRDRTPESVEKIVRSIIEERMDLDQFVECDITMRELTVIKQTLVAALSGIHHQRVAYPAIRFNKSGGVNKE